MRLLIPFTSLLMALPWVGSTVCAQQGGGGRQQRIHPAVGAIDLNSDGVISTEELKKASQSLLGLDSNKDGALSHDELVPAGLRRGGNPVGGRGAPRGGRGGRGGGGPRPDDLGVADLDLGEPAIAWYPRLEDGLAEAKRTNRPVLFMAVASQCGGVPGVF
ncbi:MAG: hypothetical protein GY899_09350 [Verrucomicrobiaceae bacterium]|nr:hypothetical protein [Verrucomicrobiaceae bacterium]